MSVSGQVSISSSIGTSLVFTVTGTQTLAYATQFQNILLGAKTVNEAVLNGDTPPATVNGADSGPLAGTYTLNFNEITAAGTYILPPSEPGAITFVDQNAASTVTGSGFGDYVLFTGINPSNTYIDVGNNNTVIFTNGDNTYEGEQTTGNDTIVAGSGNDTINTGFGSDQVFSGTGQATINLNDDTSQYGTTGFSGMFNDLVILNDGQNTVNAGGTSDDIVATSPGQVIHSTSTVSGAAAIVTILGTTPAGDSIYGGSASIAVFDSIGGNTFFGSTSPGQAYFIAANGASDTINSAGEVTQGSVVGGESIYGFGTAGSDLTFNGEIGSNVISGFAAGAGNETLNGAGFTGPGVLALFANNTTDQTQAQTVSDSLKGGAGLNGFVSGEGNETLDGGTGSNIFYIEHTADNTDSNTGTIVVQDFAQNGNWAVTLVGYTSDELNGGTAGGTPDDPSYTVKLSDGTTVEFLGVSSLTGHTF